MRDSVGVGELDAGLPAKQPAHRPSRRQEIIDAAVKVFARTGFAETSVQDVAEEAGVVPTAVYYHFAGKDELFDVALQSVIIDLDQVVERARPRIERPQGIIPLIADQIGVDRDPGAARK